MDILRFILPFLFVRNWYTGVFEFSRARCGIFLGILIFVALGLCLVVILQAPVTYTA